MHFQTRGLYLSLYFIGGPEKGRGKALKRAEGPQKGRKGFEENENVWHQHFVDKISAIESENKETSIKEYY